MIYVRVGAIMVHPLLRIENAFESTMKLLSRLLTTPSLQRKTENKIMNSPSRLESKFSPSIPFPQFSDTIASVSYQNGYTLKWQNIRLHHPDYLL